MSPPLLLVFTTGLVTGTAIATSSHHWLMVWVGLEINTLAILPIISNPKHPRSMEATTKYFLTQAVASAILLFASTMNAWQTGQWDITQLNDKYSCTMMTIALAMKMGAAPFHFWLPEVLQGSTLQTALLISTWQKIAPIVLLFSTSNHLPKKALLIMGILSTMIGGLGGINQTQLRKILAYSSISNLGWTMAAVALMPKIAIMDITIYFIMTIPMFLLLTTTATKTLKDTSTMWTTTPMATTLLTMLLLSTGGLPPLTGFLPKLVMMNEFMSQSLTPLGTLMALASLFGLLYYLRMIYVSTMTTPPISTPMTIKWRLKTHQPSSSIATLTTTALFATPVIHMVLTEA
uniref:NADH-ubiquinone oxidoreductase chain 2 n=1 Tax=Saara hardwickii TaxID=40250 RepID=Q4W8Q0_SAAHA|nr:NADH dehydrogenase subunit 2 [Saara hardwickii]BAD99380.1 NADH dehydrogenase subunit 2 [Saara hardwickii]